MNLELKREKIRKQYFSTGGLIIVSILGIAGMLMVYFSGIFNVNDFNMLYDCISKNGIMIIFGGFFFIVSLYCWILFFLNVIIKPKKEILYLYKNENSEIYFINRRGKKINYDFDKKYLEEGSYYYVLKSHDYIYEVMEKTNESWIPREKKSYWLNFYSPMGNFEGIFLLPIVYVILLPGLLILLMSKGYQKIYGVIFSVVPLYVIVYDLIYKIKLRKSNNNVIDNTNFLKSYDILKNTISIISVCIICIIFISIFFRLSDLISKIIFLPFVWCGLCNLGLVISKTFQKERLEKMFLKGYIIIFLTYWFGLLLFWTVGIVKQEGNYLFTLFSIPFWIIGFFILYKYIIKNKQKEKGISE